MTTKKSYFRYFWNYTHLVGGFVGTCSLFYCFPPLVIYACAFFTLTTDIFKELLDEISSKTKLKGRFGLDPSGGDVRDVGMCLIGVCIAIQFILKGGI